MGPLWCSLLERITPNCQQEDAYRRVMAGSDLALFSMLSGQSNSLAIAASWKKYKLGAVIFLVCLCLAMFFLRYLGPTAEHDVSSGKSININLDLLPRHHSAPRARISRGTSHHWLRRGPCCCLSAMCQN